MKKIISWLILTTVVFASPVFPAEGCEGKTHACRYETVRIRELPVSVQCWTFRKYTFVESLDKIRALGVRYVEAYPGQMLGGKYKDVPFTPERVTDEHIRWVKEELARRGLTLVTYGVCNWENTEEATRAYFEFAKKLGIRTLNTEPRFDDFTLIEQMVREYDIRVAIHNHPKPTPYWDPQTVIDRIKGLDPRIGSGADTGHWMRAGVNPLAALRRLRGRITNVHLKDLNAFDDPGAYDVPFGTGAGKIRSILAELTLQDYDGFIAVEHERHEDLPDPSDQIRQGLEYIRSVTHYQDFEQLLGRRNGRYHKHGWNHYGPGHFELDEKSGVLKGQGGMGLFWFSAKKFRDFVLELEFRCEDHYTNSGVFLRVPDMPVSDDYIHRSHEIQIDNASRGIHQTGAVYDAVAPSSLAFHEAGEWNHYRITFRGMRLTVELNGVQIIDWEAGPRGKVKSIAREGYIGLQNHDSRSPVYFRNVFVKEL
ncbi:MAG TPA: DUF1080 domain-containing protein [bacterium]|nr:DUF1080 domain-containing protein [bacterium]